MRLQTESHWVLQRFARELHQTTSARSLYGLVAGPELHAWIVLPENSRDARYAAYASQLKVDPDFLLTLHFVESCEAVPGDAERIDAVIV